MPEDETVERSAFIRITDHGNEVFLGEVHPGHRIELPNGMMVEYLWTRSHYPPHVREEER
jgi:hypothetical protein